MINLISDTITKPTQGMMEAMMRAEVGDDVFRQDPTVAALEEKVAEMFGHEEALFCPSGTMTNQIAIRIHTKSLDEIICDATSHIYLYELGGYAFNSGVSISVVNGKDGKMSAQQVEKAIRPDADWYPNTKLVTIENSCNRAGGVFYSLDEIDNIREVCKHNGLAMHLDGARLFNVLVETGETPKAYGDRFETISLCLSKGLGAPAGSVLSGPSELMSYARKVRKALGGGMRQVGFLAAAGIYALDNHVDRLKLDNERAMRIGELLSELPYIAEVLPVKTNIVIFKVTDKYEPKQFLDILEKHEILAAPMSHDALRFVFHLDITKKMMDRLEEVLRELAD